MEKVTNIAEWKTAKVLRQESELFREKVRELAFLGRGESILIGYDYQINGEIVGMTFALPDNDLENIEEVRETAERLLMKDLRNHRIKVSDIKPLEIPPSFQDIGGIYAGPGV